MKKFIHFIMILFLGTMLAIPYAYGGSSKAYSPISVGHNSLPKNLDKKKATFINITKGHFSALFTKTKKMIALNENPKKKTAILLLLFLGISGAHLFYLGYKEKGELRIYMLLATILGIAVTCILWQLPLSIFSFISLFITFTAISAGLGAYIYLLYLTLRDLIHICKNKLLPIDNDKYR